MNSIIDYNKEAVKIQPTDEVLMVDHKHLIKSAIEKEITWNTLACFLTDFVLSSDKLKDIIKTLVQELEIWVSKGENESGSEIIGVKQSFVIDKKEHDQENYSKDSEENDFVESYEMYLEDEMSETQAMEFSQNFEDKNLHDDQESETFETSNQVTIIEESKSTINQKGKNGKKHSKMNMKCDFCYKCFKVNQF